LKLAIKIIKHQLNKHQLIISSYKPDVSSASSDTSSKLCRDDSEISEALENRE